MRYLIAVLVWMLACPVWAGSNPYILGISSAPSCNPSSNEVGTRTTSSSINSSSLDVMRCNLVSADCSGPLNLANLRHSGSSAQIAKMYIYNDDGDSVPDSGDTILDYSNEISGNASSTYYTANMNNNAAVLSGASYWVCLVGGTDGWGYYYTSGTATNQRIQAVTGSFNEAPSNLSGTWGSNSGWLMDMFINIGY